MANKNLSRALVIAAIGVASYWYFSPYLSLHQMRAAAREGDAATFNAHVDYPKLRENIKGQFSSMLGSNSPAPATPDGSVESTGAAFGKMIGLALVDRMIDGMLRPEFVMQAMKEGKVSGGAGAGASGDNKDAEWTSERQGMNTFVVRVHDKRAAANTFDAGFVFERSGFAHWMLTEIKFPAIAKK